MSLLRLMWEYLNLFHTQMLSRPHLKIIKKEEDRPHNLMYNKEIILTMVLHFRWG